MKKEFEEAAAKVEKDLNGAVNLVTSIFRAWNRGTETVEKAIEKLPKKAPATALPKKVIDAEFEEVPARGITKG